MIHWQCGHERGASFFIQVLGLDGRRIHAQGRASVQESDRAVFHGEAKEWLVACVKNTLRNPGTGTKRLMVQVLIPGSESSSLGNEVRLAGHPAYFVMGNLHVAKVLWDREAADFWHDFAKPR